MTHLLAARPRSRGLVGLLVAWVLALALLVPTAARAEAGRPAGWHSAAATETIKVGRLELRYEPDLADTAAWLARRAPGWWAELERELAAGDLADDLSIILVEHAGRVATATDMPRWVAGVAHPPSGEIMIARHGPDGAPVDLVELTRHEMAHVALHRAVAGRSLPRWLHEGVAESFGGGVDLRRAETLASAVFGPGVPDMAELERAFHGADGRDASVAYATARDLVGFMRDLDGDGAAFRQVLTELRLGHDLDAAFVRAYGLAFAEIVGRWRAGLPGRFVWFALAAGGGVPFALVLPLVAAAWVRRRRVLRRAWARLEAEDRLHFANTSAVSWPGATAPSTAAS